MEDSNNPDGNQEVNIRQNNDITDNMYSYRDDNQNNHESGGAIRRSLGDVNPINSQKYNNQFGSTNNINENNINNNNHNHIDQFNISEKSSEGNQKSNLFWVTYLILGGVEGATIFALALLMEYK